MDIMKKIIKKAKSKGLNVVYDYSGRYMFGKTCLGVIGPMADLDTLLSEVKGSAEGLAKDNMGLAYIYYWPAIDGRKQ